MQSLLDTRKLLSFPILLTTVFLAVCGYLVFTHVPWLDEAQAFLLARDSHSVGELLSNMRYEGHPPLWHFLLFVITRFTTRPESMQILHLLMATASVYIVARYSPFPLIAKILFPFGYFTLFEYAVIARNYQIFLLLTLVFCAVWAHKRTAFFSLACIAALLCLTHVLGVILACALTAMLLLDALSTPAGRASIKERPIFFSMSLLLIVLAVAASIKLLIPPSDDGFAVGWRINLDSAHVLTTLSVLRDGLLPLPRWQIHFWDHNLLDASDFAVLCGCALAVVSLATLANSWRAITFFLITMVGALAFMHIKFLGSTRHHAVFFVALLAAFWIAWTPVVASSSVEPAGWQRRLSYLPRTWLVTLLTAHVYAAAVAVWFALQVPFSTGLEATDIVRKNLHPDDILVADCEWNAPSIAIWFPDRKFYFASTHQWGTFIVWRTDEAWSSPGIDGALDAVRQFNKPAIFIAHYPLKDPPPNVHFLGETTRRQIMELEHFVIYRITPPPRQM